jgi:monofunctional glycosyltransferase
MDRIVLFLKFAWKILKRVFVVLFIAQLLYIIVLRWVDPPFTITQLVDRAHGYTIKQKQVSIINMAPAVLLSAIASEDHRFLNHHGFDTKGIKKAWEENKKRRKPRGASTISQQTAKNVFLWQGGGWFRKALEAYFTGMIELCWGKKRILEVYLNVAEMGKAVYGIEAAAQTYFHKTAYQLTVNESAMILACLPNPKRYTVQPPSSYIIKRYPWIVNRMKDLRTDKAIKEFIN